MLTRTLMGSIGVGGMAITMLFAPPSNALPSTGALLVPDDITPGYYWARPTDPTGGYVEVCSDYTCDIGGGLIENYSVDGRTMIPIPSHARMVNVHYATLSPAGV